MGFLFWGLSLNPIAFCLCVKVLYISFVQEKVRRLQYVYFFLSVTREVLRLPFLSGSRERLGGEDCVELFCCLRLLAGLACRDDAVDEDATAEADLFGIFDTIDFDG